MGVLAEEIDLDEQAGLKVVRLEASAPGLLGRFLPARRGIILGLFRGRILDRRTRLGGSLRPLARLVGRLPKQGLDLRVRADVDDDQGPLRLGLPLGRDRVGPSLAISRGDALASSPTWSRTQSRQTAAVLIVTRCVGACPFVRSALFSPRDFAAWGIASALTMTPEAR